MRPLISVIIPVYNVEDYLAKCVASVLNQTYDKLEILLVDDGSTDSSGMLCEGLSKSDRRIKVIHKINGGLSSARNAGLETATGSFISFIDSDDYLADDFYETLLNVAVKDRTIASSHIVRVDENGVITRRSDPHISGGSISTEEFVRELLLHIGDVSVCSKLFRRDLIGSLRFDESKLNEDLLFITELLPKIDKINFTGRVGYYYLCRSNSISVKYGKAIEDMVSNSLIFRERALSLFPKLKVEANRFVMVQHMSYLLLLPEELHSIQNSKYKSAIKLLRHEYLKNGLMNRQLRYRDKIIILLQTLNSRMVAGLYQKRHL